MFSNTRKSLAILYKSLFNQRQIKIYNNLKNRDILKFTKNLDYQTLKLARVLKLASTNVEYYQGLNHLRLGRISYDEFQKIPLMTKDIIREYRNSLVNENYKKMSEVFRNTSGGSTGEPVEFYKTEEQAHYGTGNYWHALHLNKVDINNKSINLWGAQRDMHNHKPSYNIKSYLNDITNLNTFVLSDEIIQQYIKTINQIKPPFIKAYVHSIYDISKFINKNKIKIEFTPTIHCTTGPLYPEMRNEIRAAFNNAYVYNFYGSREVSAIATEIFNEKGLYVLYDNVFVEILDDNDKPVKNGVEGNIVITTLNNDYMPLIRYKIGDRGIKGDDLIYGTLKLDNVTGRTLGVIHKKDKSKIDGQFFTSLFFNKDGIKSFQIVQKSLYNIQLNIVKSDKFSNKQLDEIIDKIKHELGDDVIVNLEFKDQIDLTSTGKIMYVYSEIDL
ncbi:phenylacetate--CoA ligase family protein [Gelidibacter maritimus]|uniref:Phenylacetate--CoA ligase family protein n=1 Tax=Gelidibacter maritimus TaxID=2761487 RepID=A0A7W2M6I5_9FLAO|nr:phenylacetate--CoA ligase family protein [Gelidibacter maritimus]MBA6153396.1 phenylacetate--CoA ligase family protein [Gelidibacter maritimus]